MKITVTTLGDDIFTLDVSEDMELENFKALCEFECGISSTEIAVVWNGRPLHDDKRKLGDYGIHDGEVLLLQRISGAMGQPSAGRPQTTPQTQPATGAPTIPGFPMIDFGSIEMPGGAGPSRAPSQRPAASGGLSDDPATLREMLLASPHDVALLKERNPPLAEALLSGSLEKFTDVLKKQQQEKNDRERDRIRLLNADPFDPDVQDKIAEEIRLKNVESNMETAMEYAPESFGQVAMLYIDCMVNGHPVKAFVDSGAQMTIMSQNCAERCAIMRLVDRRWAGIAKGVGTQKIIGRVHLCQIKIGPDYLQSSFSILEDQPMDMLLGLDMLKRHQCCLDLRANKLVIGTTGTETPFLSEGDLPEHARLNTQSSEPSMEEDRQLAEALAKSSSESSGSSAGPSGTPSSGSKPSSPSFPEAHISQLMSHGFSRQQVVDELTRANGNIDQALAALFAKSIQFPK